MLPRRRSPSDGAEAVLNPGIPDTQPKQAKSSIGEPTQFDDAQPARVLSAGCSSDGPPAVTDAAPPERRGVRESLVMRSRSGTIRRITTEHHWRKLQQITGERYTDGDATRK